MKRSIFLTFAALLACSPALAGDDEQTYARKIRPLFERKCFDCHSSRADEVKNGLKLDTLEDVLKGGANGPAVVPGDVENSFLLRAIRYQEDDFQMPPAGRLPDKEIELIERWVKELKAAESDRRPQPATSR
jgi:mono/diheme cytochrome c family protein